MRGFLFVAVTRLFAFQIAAVQWVSNLLLSVLGNVGYFFMKLVDSERLGVYNAVLDSEGKPNELEQQNMELRLLASASQVRDHAKETDDWTDRHTEALNAIGDALIVEAGWEEDSVHRYLKELVESIDGLEYGKEEL
jgi:hypothetical protein